MPGDTRYRRFYLPDGSRGIPILGEGPYPTYHDIGKTFLLLQNNGSYRDEQLLSAGKRREALYKTEIRGKPIPPGSHILAAITCRDGRFQWNSRSVVLYLIHVPKIRQWPPWNCGNRHGRDMIVYPRQASRMDKKFTLTYYSDILCVWAYISQVRVDEVAEQFPDEVSIDYRFCSVFGDTEYKIGNGWADRGGYTGFANHICEVVSEFRHITVSPEIWRHNRPASSTPAHLLLKAVQRVDKDQCKVVMQELRSAFFERCLDISSRSVLEAILESVDISLNDVREVIDSGLAHADLAADHRDQHTLMVQGSPTFILNDGRQKLYGNVGYKVIEANIRELLRSPVAGAASWC